jgi:glucosylceramidase
MTFVQAWMKTNDDMMHGGKLLPDAASSWASYFSKWIQAYQDHNISIWGVTVQNEPEAAQPWESCLYTSEEESLFVANYLGPVLNKDWPEVKIFGYDHNKDDIVEWAGALLGNTESAQYVDGIAFHW